MALLMSMLLPFLFLQSLMLPYLACSDDSWLPERAVLLLCRRMSTLLQFYMCFVHSSMVFFNNGVIVIYYSIASACRHIKNSSKDTHNNISNDSKRVLVAVIVMAVQVIIDCAFKGSRGESQLGRLMSMSATSTARPRRPESSNPTPSLHLGFRVKR